MASSTGRSGSSKIAIRGLGKLFTHIPAPTRLKIENAFLEAEELADFHNRSVLDRQTKRTPTGLISAPVISTKTSIRGIEVTWDRLDDPKITFYEVQVSTDNIFSSPRSFKTFTNGLALDGETDPLFVRVRGVRSDGTSGPFSDTESVTPASTVINVRTSGTSDVSSTTFTPSTDVFASIHKTTFTPTTSSGSIAIFGSLGLQNEASSTNSFGIDLRFLVNGRIISDYGARLRNTGDQSGGEDVYNVLVSSGAFKEGEGISGLISSKGGFSTGFNGFLTLPATSHQHEDFFPDAAAESGSNSGPGTFTGWTNPSNATGEPVPSGNSASSNRAEFQIDYVLADGTGTSETKFIELTDLDFDIPSDHTIVGIQVLVNGIVITAGTVADDSFIGTISLIDDTGTIRSTDRSNGTVLWPRKLVGNAGWIPRIIGGSTDLWGEAAGFWTPAKINSSNFGVALTFQFEQDTASNLTIEVGLDSISVLVFTTKTEEVEIDIQARAPSAPSAVSNEIINCAINSIEFSSES